MKSFSIKRFSFYVCLAGTVLILAAVSWGIYEHRTFTKNTHSAKGTVIGFSEKTSLSENPASISSRRSVSYAPIVRFTTQRGKIIRFISDTSSRLSIWSKGESVEVLYDPSHPENAVINSFVALYLGPAAVGGIGLFLFLCSCGILVLPRLKGRKIRELQQSGDALETTFLEVSINRNIGVGGKHPHKVITQWTDPATKETHTFASDNLWYNPTDQITREEITVYMERGNPKKYYMDLSFLDPKKTI